MTFWKATAISACVSASLSSIVPAFAGGPSEVNPTGGSVSSQLAATSAASDAVSSVTHMAATVLNSAKPGNSAALEVYGKVVTVTLDGSGGILLDGQPLAANGLPNLALLISFDYGGV
ncbi:MAG: hypothetical protein EP341_06010 [Sphingomonadales bacterium]|nr:MAG: hypothetical protein EP341_06010 [Sphingomonadales bacterium]